MCFSNPREMSFSDPVTGPRLWGLPLTFLGSMDGPGPPGPCLLLGSPWGPWPPPENTMLMEKGELHLETMFVIFGQVLAQGRMLLAPHWPPKMSQAAQPGILSRPGDAFLNEPQILKFLSYHSLLPIWYMKPITVNKTLWAQQIKPWSNSVLRGQKPPLNYNDK